MEIGINLSGELLGNDSYRDPHLQHQAIQRDLRMIKQADKYGLKYAFMPEHHTLTQYSHLSASEMLIAYALAQTERIHVGSGIWPLNPATNHPVRVAERVAMIDHLSNGRFEFGTGRGAGSWELGTFGLDPAETKEIWEEVIWEFTKMWDSDDPRMGSGTPYSHDGPAFRTPPRNILPKPYGGAKTHPPIWSAVANIPTFQKAASHGIGVLGFGLLGKDRKALAPYVAAYKETIADAEPVGRYVNDNFCIVAITFCAEDSKDAREGLLRSQVSYFSSLTYLYHDSFPIPETAARWPEQNPEPTEGDIDAMTSSGALMCGSPEEVIAQAAEYEAVGVDTLLISIPSGPIDVALNTIKVVGEKVAPHFDSDPIHRTDRARYGNRAEAIVADRTLAAMAFDSSSPSIRS